MNCLHFLHSYSQFIFPSEFLGKNLELLHVWVLDSGRNAMEFFGTLYRVIYMLLPLDNLFYACVTGLVLDFCFGDLCFRSACVGPSGPCNFTSGGKKYFPKRQLHYILRGKKRTLSLLFFFFPQLGRIIKKQRVRRTWIFKIGQENIQLKC